MTAVIVELAADLVWLRGGLNITHFAVIVVFYLLWRLPGARNNGNNKSVEVWYDALQNLPPSGVFSDDESSVVSSDNGDGGQKILSPEDDQWLQNQLLLYNNEYITTPMERQRFFIAKGRNRIAAARRLRIYMDWRTKHEFFRQQATVTPPPPTGNNNNNTMLATAGGTDGGTDAGVAVVEDLSEDERIWNEVSLIALKARNEKHCEEPLPKVAFVHQLDGDYVRDKSGHRLFHFMPGRMDDGIASTVTYALAVALYIDRRLDRQGDEKVTVVIDTRGGHGWRNLNAAQLLPFVQHLSKLLLTMFPERLYRALVFPIPSRFFWVWRMARNCIDPLTREKICPLMGPSTIDSPPPMDKIAEYMSGENALLLESKRKASFGKP